MTDVYADLQPRELWKHFDALNQIPRRSGNEAAARAYVQQVAAAAGATTAIDAAGNAVVRAAASPGRETAPAVVIQAHLDMVCEKRPDVVHDFDRDPIRPRREGDRIFASGTTLGADNGIGAAAALAMLTESGLAHGPLELLFTIEEETGLTGAMAVDPALVSARLMINLDSEDPEDLTIGCAGGGGVSLRLPIAMETAPAGWTGREVVVSGLKGGHSGVQIHEPLANAIKLLTRTLLAAQGADVEFRVASVRGGAAHNAIPRDAVALLAVSPEAVPDLERIVAETAEALRAEWSADEPRLALETREAAAPAAVLAAESQARLVSLLDGLPHGVLKMSDIFPGKVETSSNLAQVQTEDGAVQIGTSSRSFVEAELEAVQARIVALGQTARAAVDVREGYPGWEPDPNSRLLAVTERVYREVFGHPANVQVIHAGLECGVIVSQLPGMEAISFGPRIRDAHTPEEHVYPDTVVSTWKLLTALLNALSQPA